MEKHPSPSINPDSQEENSLFVICEGTFLPNFSYTVACRLLGVNIVLMLLIVSIIFVFLCSTLTKARSTLGV